MNETTNKIAQLNDLLRTDPLSYPFWLRRIVRTHGVDTYPYDSLKEIIRLVREFNDFTPANDPYGEHDFGSFDYQDKKFFWKIDYYSPDMKSHSEDPANMYKTLRVLTIMLAEEY